MGLHPINAPQGHRMSDPLTMDWKKLISELMASGMKQGEIGEAVGLSQAAISELATGQTKDARWRAGERLRALHRRRIRSTAPKAPA